MSGQNEYAVELIVFITADSHTDAEALGERAAKEAAKAITHQSGRAKITNVILSDVREYVEDEDDPAGEQAQGEKP